MRGRILVTLVVVLSVVGCAALKGEKPAGKTAATAATLALTVNVKGAEVYIDDMLFGQIQKAGAAQNFVVAAGKHSLAVKKFGYEDKKLTIGVEAGGTNTLSVELARTPVVPVSVKEEKPAETKAK